MSLNKYERCTFLSQNAVLRNRLSSGMCRWHFHFILPIKCLIKQHICGAALCTAVTGEAAIFARKAPPIGRE